MLPAYSQKTVRTLVFIAQMAPLLQTTQIGFCEAIIFNSAWYSMGLPERIQITNSIIYKSLNKAIAEKKETMARLAATFAGGTHSTREAGRKSYSANMLRFYEQTGDTANYLTNALTYYNTYLMTVNIDSVKRTDSINRAKLLLPPPPKRKLLRAPKPEKQKW